MAITNYTCQMHCSLAVAGILLYLAPSFVVLMSALLWKAPLTKRKLLALALSFAGCALVSGIVGGDSSVSAVVLLLGGGAGFCYATFTIFAHYGLAHYDSYTMIYWTFLVAGIGSLCFLNPTELAAAMPDSRLWLGTAGLVVIATVLPYIFYTKGLEGVESGKASIIANVEPVVAALPGVVLKIAPLGDASSGVTTYDVTVTVSGEDERVKGGMNVSGEIVVNAEDDAILIPTDALQKDDAGYYVTLESGETRRVTLGVMTDETTQILDGIGVGETVVY